MTKRTLLLAVIAVVAGVCTTLTAAANDGKAYVAVVTGDKVYARSGAANSYYPIGQVNSGDLVLVTDEKFNWARVVTTGPTFTADRFFGYIIYASTQSGRFRLSEDGKSGITLGHADVLAPNFNTRFNPNDSWKPLIRLEPGTDVQVLETLSTANNTVHKIVLPGNAEVWISMAFLRRADEAEVGQWRAWERSLEGQGQQKAGAEQAAGEDLQERSDEQQQEQAVAETPAADEGEGDAGEAVEIEQQVTQDQEDAEPDELIEQAVIEEAEAVEQPAEVSAEEAITPSLGNVQPEGGEEAEGADSDGDGQERPLTERLSELSLDDLEEAYRQLRADELEEAEIEPLREMYLRFAERVEGSDRSGAAFARSRAEQLELLGEIQQRRVELQQIRARARISAERAEAARLATEAGGDYIAVGRLSSSTIYDGRRLPRMFRLQDPGTGRTVAYVEAGEDDGISQMLGQLIGVVGEKRYDGALRLNILKPRRVDILAPR